MGQQHRLRTKCGWWWGFYCVKDKNKFELKVRDIKSIVLRNTLANFVQNCEKHVFLRGTSEGQISTFLNDKKITRFYIRFQLITNNMEGCLVTFEFTFFSQVWLNHLRRCRWWQLWLHYKFKILFLKKEKEKPLIERYTWNPKWEHIKRKAHVTLYNFAVQRGHMSFKGVPNHIHRN